MYLFTSLVFFIYYIAIHKFVSISRPEIYCQKVFKLSLGDMYTNMLTMLLCVTRQEFTLKHLTLCPGLSVHWGSPSVSAMTQVLWDMLNHRMLPRKHYSLLNSLSVILIWLTFCNRYFLLNLPLWQRSNRLHAHLWWTTVSSLIYKDYFPCISLKQVLLIFLINVKQILFLNNFTKGPKVTWL